jgi:hypothetical protein
MGAWSEEVRFTRAGGRPGRQQQRRGARCRRTTRRGRPRRRLPPRAPRRAPPCRRTPAWRSWSRGSAPAAGRPYRARCRPAAAATAAASGARARASGGRGGEPRETAAAGAARLRRPPPHNRPRPCSITPRPVPPRPQVAQPAQPKRRQDPLHRVGTGRHRAGGMGGVTAVAARSAPACEGPRLRVGGRAGRCVAARGPRAPGAPRPRQPPPNPLSNTDPRPRRLRASPTAGPPYRACCSAAPTTRSKTTGTPRSSARWWRASWRTGAAARGGRVLGGAGGVASNRRGAAPRARAAAGPGARPAAAPRSVPLPCPHPTPPRPRYLAQEGCTLEWLLANPELKTAGEVAARAASKRVGGRAGGRREGAKCGRRGAAPAGAPLGHQGACLTALPGPCGTAVRRR